MDEINSNASSAYSPEAESEAGADDYKPNYAGGIGCVFAVAYILASSLLSDDLYVLSFPGIFIGLIGCCLSPFLAALLGCIGLSHHPRGSAILALVLGILEMLLTVFLVAYHLYVLGDVPTCPGPGLMDGRHFP